MKVSATINAGLALSMFLASFYHHEIGLAGAWFSSFIGWTILSIKAWWGDQ